MLLGDSRLMEIVIITGACGGIGRELVREYQESGFHVLAIDSKPKIPELGDVNFLQFDLSKLVIDKSSRMQFKTRVLEQIGSRQVKAIINNAAIQNIKAFEDIDTEDWMETLSINVLAPFVLIKLFFEELTKSEGSIVNISSIHASQTKKGFTVYATSKAALSSLTKLLAIELGNRVRVNAIEPGAISTQMLEAGFSDKPEKRQILDAIQPMERIGQPREVAELSVFLTSNKAKFINGATIAIDGGIRNQLHDPL